MIIAKVETFPLRIPFKPGHTTAASAWSDQNAPSADSLLVRITTDEGLEGWGEAFGFRAVPLVKLAIDDLIAPLCLGRDATQITALMLEAQQRLHIFGRSGALAYAVSAIDIGLWDIAGKTANAPVHRLLGGGVADLPCYASLSAYADPEQVRAEVRRTVEAGFGALKLHETEPTVVAVAREEAGPDIELMLDVNCAWTLDQAEASARALRSFGLKWLEEPVRPPENYDGLARLRRSCGIPIAAGENISTLMEFDRLMTHEAVDFVQPSPAKMGGITEMCKVFPIAATRNVAVMPHTFYDGPGLLAGIHVAAALGTVDTQIEWRNFDLEAHVLGDALVVNDGRVVVPQGAGLGIDPDPDVIRRYARKLP